MSKKQGAVRAKQKKVVKNFIENHGNLSKAMKDAGYSDSYAHNQDIVDTKTWKELIEEVFPDKEVTDVVKAALKAKLVLKNRLAAIETDLTDYDIALKAADMILKIKGSYAPEKIQEVKPFEDLSDAELDELLNQKEKELNIAKVKKSKKKQG